MPTRPGFRVRPPKPPKQRNFFNSPPAPGRRLEDNRTAQLALAQPGFGAMSAVFRALSAAQPQGPPDPTDTEGVRATQAYLNKNGRYGLSEDGVYGPQTDAAFKDYAGKRDASRLQEREAAAIQRADARNRRNQATINQAVVARRGLAAFADQLEKQAGMASTVRQMRAIAADPLKYDNAYAVQVYADTKRALAASQARKPKKPKGIKRFGLAALSAVSEPIDQLVFQPYYGGKKAQLRGASTATQARATVAGFPGLGFLAGKGTRKDVEAVNSFEERAALTDRGQLASIGEFVSGRAEDKLRGAARENYRAQGGPLGTRARIAPTPIRGPLSAGIDAGVQIVADPLNALTLGLGSLSKIGNVAEDAGLRVAARRAGLGFTDKASVRAISKALGAAESAAARQAGRAAWLKSTTGTALLAKGGQAIVKTQDVKSLTKAIKGLDTGSAQKIIAAAKTGGVEAGVRELGEAFIRGSWNPTVRLRNEAAVAATGRGVGGAVRTTSARAGLRNVAFGNAAQATVATKRPDVLIDAALDVSLRKAQTLAPDFYNEKVRAGVAGLGYKTRLLRVEDQANKIRTAASAGGEELSTAVDAELNRLSALVERNRPSQATQAERAVIREQMEQGLRRLEALEGVLAGKAGKAAKEQAEAVVSQTGRAVSGPGLNPVKQAARFALSIADEAAPTTVRFEGAANPYVALTNRVEDLHRWATALGADETTLYSLRAAAEKAVTEEEVFKIVRDAVVRYGESNGVDPKRLVAALEDRFRDSQLSRAFAIGEDGELVRGVQVLSQRIEHIPLVRPEELATIVRQLRADAGSKGARVGLAIRKPADSVVGRGLKAAHRQWKFNIVTNAYAPVVGAAAGFATGDDAEGRLKGAAFGAGIGLLGPVRYGLRVAGIEERLIRYHFAGSTLGEWVPFYSKWARTRGLDNAFLSHAEVRAGGMPGGVSNRFLVSVDPDWIALKQKDARFLSGWDWIVNKQLHAETDAVAQLFLAERAGLATAADTLKAAMDFFKTAEGKVHLRRLTNALEGPKNASEAVDRYRSFVNDYVPAEVAAARLQGPVERSLLKAALKNGTAPEAVHAQRTWILPRSGKDLFSSFNQVVSKAVFEGPTTKLSRIPMAEWTYAREYHRLTRLGMDPLEAQKVADEFAVRRTNEIMFQIDDESRFARKVDFVFPFQQPREELLRVYAKLAFKNPARTFRAARLVALAFNNGQDQGVFRERQFFAGPGGKEWVLSVPGSAYLSRALGGVPTGFDGKLKDFLFFGQGAYGINVLPSPGGPTWATLSRLYFNRHPEALENLPEWQREVLFPYGTTGKLARNELSRLHMAFTGEPPPWEFASRKEQEDELGKWRLEIFLQLQFAGRKKSGNPDYEPTDAEVNKALGAFMRQWAMTGSVFPAAPQPVFPTAKAFDVAKELYTNKVTGKFDYVNFVSERPEWAPFLQKKSEYTGPDDMKHWTRTQEERAKDKMLHYSKPLALKEFRETLAESRQTAEAWKEFSRLKDIPVPMEREAALIKWRQANPNVAVSMRDTYFRDQELARIESTYSPSQKPAALDRWRKEYDVSFGQYKRLKEKVKTFEANPWRAARYTEDVVSDVDGARKRGLNTEAYVATLQPAEQVRYWQAKQADLDYESGEDPQKVLDRYYVQKRHISVVFKGNPELRSYRPKSRFEEAAARWKGDYGKQVSLSYAEVAKVREAMDKAAQAKDWSAYYALKDKRTALYDQIRGLKNAQYRSMPELDEFESEVSALLYFQKPGRKGTFVGDGSVDFIPSNEQQNFLSMPQAVKEAYLDDLLAALQTPSGQKGKLFYEWLTEFQKDLLDSNLEPEAVEGFKAQHAGADGASGTGSGGSKVGGELGYAYAMFKEYSTRPAGATPPAAYAGYLALPRNPAVRSQYVKAHPEVGAWLKSGPMANMPPLVRMTVANIMVKHGKWDGEEKSVEEITELSFAREQLSRWNRRTGDRPPVYDYWVNLPTGPDKALFLREHPEIGEWLRLGPMANMPEEYRDVVRDIMQRYGEWTAGQDPLGKTIADYYKVPSYEL